MNKENAQLTDIAWLAGFMDGESHLSLTINKRGGGAIYTRVGITNTGLDSIKKCERIIAAITGRPGMRRYIWRAGGYKPRYDLMVTKHADVRAICLAIQPFAIGKVEHIRTMLHYLDISPGHAGRKNGVSRFGPEHYALVANFRKLNQRHGPSPKNPKWSEARDQTAGSADADEEMIRTAS